MHKIINIFFLVCFESGTFVHEVSVNLKNITWIQAELLFIYITIIW